MRLKDKVCLITGAASGMGKAATRLFVEEGASVIALDVNKKEGIKLAYQLNKGKGGHKVHFIACDVSKEKEIEKAVKEGAAKFGKLDVLYNNAGIFLEKDRSVLDTPEDVWDLTMNVNVKGIYLVCKYGIPHLIKNGKGSVINVASFVALVGCSVPQDAYTASKGAVIALTKSLAVQFGPKGVRSNAICPGPIETPLLMDWLLKNPAEKAKRFNRIPMGRFGKPEDIVHTALHLASDESAWTNGAAIVVDGGITSNYF